MKVGYIFFALACLILGSCHTSKGKTNSGYAQNYSSQPPNKSIYVNYDIGEHEWYFTTSDSVKLYVLEFGKGSDTILVLHGGFGAEHRYLIDAFEGLYDKYHFIFYDQRGSLRSPCPVGKISIQKHVSDIEEIRKELSINKLNLFGHSNGTTLATFYLNEHPGNVKGFIMTACMQMQWPLDSALKKVEEEIYVGYSDFMKRPEIQEEINKVNSDNSLPASKKKTQIERINMAKHYLYDISLWRKGKEPFGPFMNQQAGNATVKTIPKGDYDNRTLYSNHPYPITIIMGEYDMIDPGGKKFLYWTKGISNIHYVMLEKAAHDAWIDKPVEFCTAFENAMNKYKTQ